ncbi:histone deacetylase [Chloropicon primus]|uniref:Histone deacetylase n=1 Tax=Chloropicon primus TaxID=1764295 RepID=A0A5B8MY34_9CHLO|nr:histone deacetylase [Chloropicon primus]UPR03681.1 histone deacetylase [Chloropicon primus]|eukprot:QDZ24472.1 histone deacetylase [Chloropicon primus]
MKVFTSDWAHEKLPAGHKFPMDKYRLVREELETDLTLRGKVSVVRAPLITQEELEVVHCKGYVERVLRGNLTAKENRRIGFPWTKESVTRYRASAGGTLAALHAVMGVEGSMVAAHAAGGTHHAFRDAGEGFCVFNDIALAAVTAETMYPEAALPILVIDLDVHQGNGTADIFQSKSSVFTFSIHGANNYPWKTRRKSDLDVEVPDDTTDAEYLDVLARSLEDVFLRVKPRLVIYQAGVDGLREDSLGRLALTRQGLIRRNNLVYDMCIRDGCKLVITMGGGYSRPIDATVDASVDIFRVAALKYCARSSSSSSR